ncbi:hypothetical protein HK096_007712 [Nowakowskiella sp. JEL0078]|nr:hypothetical protein HK096_007712 [Nowakowskiella sp. JEL0078]
MIFQPTCTDGAVLSILDLFASNQLFAFPRICDRQSKFRKFQELLTMDIVLRLKRQVASENSEQIVSHPINHISLQSIEDIDFKNANITNSLNNYFDENDFYLANSIVNEPKIIVDKIVSEDAILCIKNCDFAEKEPLKNLYQAIESTGFKGISLLELQQIAPEFNIILGLNQLMNIHFDETNIPLIFHVGFNTHRFITHNWIHAWTINFNEKIAVESDFIDPNLKIRYSPPKIWFDMYGNKVNWILRVCLSTVLSHILMCPGINEVQNYSKKLK